MCEPKVSMTRGSFKLSKGYSPTKAFFSSAAFVKLNGPVITVVRSTIMILLYAGVFVINVGGYS